MAAKTANTANSANTTNTAAKTNCYNTYNTSNTANTANTTNTANTANTANTVSAADTANITNAANTTNTAAKTAANTANIKCKSIILEDKTFKKTFYSFFLSSWLYWSFKKLLSIKENGGNHLGFMSTLRTGCLTLVQRNTRQKMNILVIPRM